MGECMPGAQHDQDPSSSSSPENERLGEPGLLHSCLQKLGKMDTQNSWGRVSRTVPTRCREGHVGG
jgi:hypothetical protein